MQEGIKGLKKYYGTHYWEAKRRNHPHNLFYSLGYLLVTTIRGFIYDDCFDKASTLTFYSLLALIPLVAIGFGIAQQFGLDARFAEEVKKQLEAQPQIAEKIIEFSNAALKTTKGGLIAGLGLLVFLWTAFRMIVNIATYFNAIWNVKRPRTFFGQMKDFIPLILLFPLFLVGSSSLIITISTFAYFTPASILKYVGPLLFTLLDFLPILLVWALLTFLYIFLPNTKVKWQSGIVAGFVASLLYQLWQWIYITFQFGAAKYGAIYGSFAAVPLFLLWLNYSWVIILFGAELAAKLDKLQKA